jgi:hypothetical protein
MSQTVAIRPPHGHRLPGRLLAIAIAAVFVIATVVTVTLFVAARDSGPGSAPAVDTPTGADSSEDRCVPTRVPTAC